MLLITAITVSSPFAASSAIASSRATRLFASGQGIRGRQCSVGVAFPLDAVSRAWRDAMALSFADSARGSAIWRRHGPEQRAMVQKLANSSAVYLPRRVFAVLRNSGLFDCGSRHSETFRATPCARLRAILSSRRPAPAAGWQAVAARRVTFDSSRSVARAWFARTHSARFSSISLPQARPVPTSCGHGPPMVARPDGWRDTPLRRFPLHTSACASRLASATSTVLRQ